MSTTITQQAIERIKSMLAVAAEHQRGTTALFVEDVRAVLIRNAELERELETKDEAIRLLMRPAELITILATNAGVPYDEEQSI